MTILAVEYVRKPILSRPRSGSHEYLRVYDDPARDRAWIGPGPRSEWCRTYRASTGWAW